jgi:segregation and condensation protein B
MATTNNSKLGKQFEIEENESNDNQVSQLVFASSDETHIPLVESNDLTTDQALFLSDSVIREDGFLPEANDEIIETNEVNPELITSKELTGTELEDFEAAQIEDLEFVEDERVESIVESILFASDRPVSFASIHQVFKGTTVKKEKIRKAIESLAVEYAGGRRGVTLEEVTGGYQIRTKIDNMNFLKRTLKPRSFKLSGPALETLSIVAYKQPVIKMEIDQIRGVESGHLLRALMEKGLVNFEGKAENLPGKPMQYGTTRKFLEIFGLRNLKELPTLSQIDELLPEGIGEESQEKPTLSMVTESMAEEVKTVSYSQGEEELSIIEDQLTSISTSSDFFEQEKLRQKMKRDEEKAQNIREALAVGEEVSSKDKNWLRRYEESLLTQNKSEDSEILTNQSVIQSTDSLLESGHTSESSRLDFAEDLNELTKNNLLANSVEGLDFEDDHIENEIPFFEEADQVDEGDTST